MSLFIHETLYNDYFTGEIFKTVISIYAHGENCKVLPLPSLEEVLICDHNTTVEEVNHVNVITYLLLPVLFIFVTGFRKIHQLRRL